LSTQSPESEFDLSENTTPQNISVEYIGLSPEALSVARQEVAQLVESLKIGATVPLVFKLTSQNEEEIKRIAKKSQVEVLIRENQIELKGLPTAIFNVRQEIMELLLEIGKNTEKVSYPPTWGPQTVNCELKPLLPNSYEWNMIDKRMKETIPNIQIQKIERIQNKWLWEKYCAARRVLHKKNDGNVNEMNLFHGTSSNDPAKIYNGEHGFDMRYCSSGMWGIAIYFARNASYSNSYRFTTPDKKFQMFLASVLVGDCTHVIPNDSSLRKPPSKSTKNSLGFKEDYDSVSGDTRGSKVYMIYENGRAYPQYLITYTAEFCE